MGRGATARYAPIRRAARYPSSSAIGTPYCVTVDFDSLDDNAVTVRDRDTMGQERVPIAELEGYLASRLIGA